MSIKGTDIFRKRLLVVCLFFFLLLIAIFSRAYHLQVVSGKELKGLAKKQHTSAIMINSERGVIYDRNGEKLAVSVMAKSLFADPAKVSRPEEAAKRLAPVLQADPGALLKKLTRGGNFSWLARRLTPEQTAAIEKLSLDGIYFIEEPRRFYPNGETAAHLLGFVGNDSSGLEGLELKYDGYLKGSPEQLVWARDAKGKRLYPRTEKPSGVRDRPLDLILTLDRQIQYLVESHLREAVRAKDAKGGIAIVMNPKTGEILALVSEPGFDPNGYLSAARDTIRNKAIVDSFDPGSIFKPILAAAALEEGTIRENDKIYCERGQYVVGDRVIHEARKKSYQQLSFTEVMKYSSNIGFVKIAERLGKEKYYHYITRFGFGAKTGIDLPGEAPGILRPPKQWTRVDTAAISFGQGISVTALQMITAFSAIANDGVVVKPYLVKAIADKDGGLVKEFVPAPAGRVISPETARRLSRILSQVVTAEDGTGKNARIEHISIAGKTGTSQKYDFGRRQYSTERVKTSFIGFFPVDDPKIAIIVILDEPKRDKWGGLAAAPVFRSIGERILTCLKTGITENMEAQRKIEDLKPHLKWKLVSAEPAQASTGLNNSEPAQGVMPDFRGLTIRDTIRLGQKMGIDIKIRGSGWAVYQAPAPGVPLGEKPGCQVSFSPG